MEVDKERGRNSGKEVRREGENKRVFKYPRRVVNINILFIFSLFFYSYFPLFLHLLSYIRP